MKLISIKNNFETISIIIKGTIYQPIKLILSADSSSCLYWLRAIKIVSKNKSTVEISPGVIASIGLQFKIPSKGFIKNNIKIKTLQTNQLKKALSKIVSLFAFIQTLSLAMEKAR